MNATSVLLTAPIAPTLARLAAPNIAAMFIMLATNAAEAWYVGHLGTISLAGLALAFPMLMLTTMLSAGAIGGAIAGAVATRLGAGDTEGAEALSFHALLLALIISSLFAVLFIGLGSSIYGLLGGRGQVLEQALAYSNLLFAGCAAPWLANTLSSLVRASGQMNVAARAMIVGSLVQIAVGGILVFGLGPIPALGIAGAAWGVIVGFSVNALMQFFHLLAGRGGLTLRLRGIPVRFVHFKALLRVGLLAALSPLSSVATVIVITGFAARLGVEALAGYGIGARLEFLMIPVVFGIGAASITMIGVNFGAGHIDRGHRIAWTAAIGAALVTGTVGMTAAVFPNLWAESFTTVAAVQETCRIYLRAAGPFYAFFGLGLCLYFASQGARKVLWPVLAGLLRLATIIAGGALLVATDGLVAENLFRVIAVAMLVYGLFTAAAVRLGAWRTRPARSE